jgi:hypothetical protein
MEGDRAEVSKADARSKEEEKVNARLKQDLLNLQASFSSSH